MLIGKAQERLAKEKRDMSLLWGVVVILGRTEDRDNIARKMIESLDINIEYMKEFLSRTPLLLWDGLSESSALRARRFLISCGAEASITDNAEAKKSCNRIHWPDPVDIEKLKVEEPKNEDPHIKCRKVHEEENAKYLAVRSVKEDLERELRELKTRSEEIAGKLEVEIKKKKANVLSAGEKKEGEGQDWIKERKKLLIALFEVRSGNRKMEKENKLAWNYFEDKIDALKKKLTSAGLQP